jgi:hypothetical protein
VLQCMHHLLCDGCLKCATSPSAEALPSLMYYTTHSQATTHKQTILYAWPCFRPLRHNEWKIQCANFIKTSNKRLKGPPTILCNIDAIDEHKQQRLTVTLHPKTKHSDWRSGLPEARTGHCGNQCLETSGAEAEASWRCFYRSSRDP